jgi:hypothetical protein
MGLIYFNQVELGQTGGPSQGSGVVMRFSGFVLGVFLVVGQAQADPGIAMLETIEGEVFVNSGKGFQIAKPEMSLAEGNRLLVRENAAAILSFAADGCFQSLREPGLYIVKKESCVAGETRVERGAFNGKPATSNTGIAVTPIAGAGAAAGAAAAGAAIPSGSIIASAGFAGTVGAAYVATTYFLRRPVSAD